MRPSLEAVQTMFLAGIVAMFLAFSNEPWTGFSIAYFAVATGMSGQAMMSKSKDGGANDG